MIAVLAGVHVLVVVLWAVGRFLGWVERRAAARTSYVVLELRLDTSRWDAEIAKAQAAAARRYNPATGGSR
jgi:hypothetical protein